MAKVRATIGVLTAILFLSLGVMTLGEDQGRVGGLLLALGVLRGIFAIQQVRVALGAAEAPSQDGNSGGHPADNQPR